MSVFGIILIVLLALLIFGAVPGSPYAHPWGGGISGGLGIVLVILLILVLMGRL